MKRCEKCILPESYPGIRFDQNGVCNRCAEWYESFNQIDYAGLRKKLDHLIEARKKEARLHGSPFDVVVPVSGGKDSAYVLYVMKEVYNCRVLAVNYHNTLQTELAYKNLVQLTDVFNVDFRMINIKPSLLKRAYQACMIRYGEFCMVCNCTGYWLMLSFLGQLFGQYGYLPIIVGGWSKLFEFDPQINTLNFGLYRELLESTGLINEFLEVLDPAVLDSLTGKGDVRQQNSGGFIQLPDYWPWNHTEILETLSRIGWQRMKGKDTHFDCWASPLADILERRKYGLNQKTTILASNVRAGILDREKALQTEILSMYELQDEYLANRFANHIDVAVDLFLTKNNWYGKQEAQ